MREFDCSCFDHLLLLMKLLCIACVGDVSNTATFVNEDGMLKLAPWTPASFGDVRFHFKTPYGRGVLLSNGDLNKDYVQLEIQNETTMALTFDIGNGAQVIHKAVKKGKLNDREWHKVTIFRNLKEFALEVDGEQTTKNLDLTQKRDLDVERPLYVGSDAKALNGFVGCIRGLVSDFASTTCISIKGSRAIFPF